MAKKKFNSEERRAIIRKLKNVARERTDASWEKHRAAYKPSEVYLKAQALIEQRNNACKELRNIDHDVFQNWNYFEEINAKRYLGDLGDLRDKEIKHLVERYEVNETDLEVEIILMDQDKSVEDLIENLLKTCLCK